MNELCTDNRFEVIAAYKKKLIESTNIETSPNEMAVIDNVLFRFWQMGWLPPVPHGRLIDADALMEIIKAHDYPLRAHFNSTDNGMFTIGIQQAVDETPTIILAEEDK